MRIKIQNILFVFLLAIVSPSGFVLVLAQEANFPGTESDELEIDKEKEKMLYSPGDLDPSFRKTQTSTYKDSVVLKPTVRSTKVQPSSDPAKNPAKQPSQEDDSILSFNFLYYIFQKYKLQDIVD